MWRLRGSPKTTWRIASYRAWRARRSRRSWRVASGNCSNVQLRGVTELGSESPGWAIGGKAVLPRLRIAVLAWLATFAPFLIIGPHSAMASMVSDWKGTEWKGWD